MFIRIARNLIETQRVRAKAYREPYLADGPEFKQFEAEFVYPPTVDQQACFDVSLFKLYFLCSTFAVSVLLSPLAFL